MEISAAVISVIVGFLALAGGGEFLVRSSAKLAAVFGVPPLVIGLTVVASATTAPELAVAVQSALAGKTDLAIGNAVGSFIFNILFILGLSALISPIVVTARLIRLDVPLLIGAAVLLLMLSLDGILSRWDGALLFSLLVGYVVWTIHEARKAQRSVKQQFADRYEVEVKKNQAADLWLQLGFLLTGDALLVIGAHFTVDGCVVIATAWGVSELIIGLTVIAMGTSLPEVVTSLVAGIRGQRDISVGNIIGANMFNVLGVLGLGSLVAPDGIGVSINAIRFDMPVMVVVAVVCLPIFFVGHRIARWEGAILFSYYWVYTVYLILHATGHGFGRVFNVVLLMFLIPLTTITLLAGVYRYWRKPKNAVVNEV